MYVCTYIRMCVCLYVCTRTEPLTKILHQTSPPSQLDSGASKHDSDRSIIGPLKSPASESPLRFHPGGTDYSPHQSEGPAGDCPGDTMGLPSGAPQLLTSPSLGGGGGGEAEGGGGGGGGGEGGGGGGEGEGGGG